MSRALRLSAYILIGVFLASLARAETPVTSTKGAPRVLTIGDSLMAFHSTTGRSISHNLTKALGTKVTDRSLVGARMGYKLPISGALGLSIPMQFRGDWDWVVMTGGGNDLWLGCGCHKCDRRLNKLIHPSGTKGQIPQLMAKIHESGARIIYVGYLRSPDIGSPIESCKDEGDELERRVAALASRVDGIDYISLQDLVQPGDKSFFAIDRVHPSVKASRYIAARVAAFIQNPG